MAKKLEEELINLDEGSTRKDMFFLLEENTYVGLNSASKFEEFYLFYITHKDIANETIHDIRGHIVQEGQAYL